MGLIGIGYCVIAYLMVSTGSTQRTIDLGEGVRNLWNPALIMALQALWAISFIRSGKSSVTGSMVTLCIHEDKI